MNLFMPDSSTWFSCPAPRQIRRSPHEVVAGSEYIGLPLFRDSFTLGGLPPFSFGPDGKADSAASPMRREMLAIPFLHGILSSVA